MSAAVTVVDGAPAGLAHVCGQVAGAHERTGERCGCPCSAWGHTCSAGTAAVGVLALCGGQRVGLGVCRPCLAELVRLLPPAALRQVS
jgi:hypothetical protein